MWKAYLLQLVDQQGEGKGTQIVAIKVNKNLSQLLMINPNL